MPYSRILIDVSGLYFRAFYSFPQVVSNVEGKRMVTGGVLASIRMIQRVEEKYLSENGRIYFLFDNPSSGELRRKDIDPDYKKNRKKQDPKFYRGLDYLQLVFRNYKSGYRIIQRPESEADDLVFPILKSFEGHNHNVLLVSNDMDWGRAISDCVCWMVHLDGRDIIYNTILFYNKFGFHPGYDEICLYKALLGDKSDNIVSGVKGIPEQTVFTIIHQAGSVRNMFLNLDSIEIEYQWKQAIRQNRGRIQLNLMLVECQPLSEADVREYTVISEYDKKSLLMYYRILGFNAGQIDPRMIKKDEPVDDENFFNSFDSYPRAE
jgi:5'-3' exonuclease